MKTIITTDERIQHVSERGDSIVFKLVDGRQLSVPLDWFPRLARADQAERSKYEIRMGGFAVSWPTLDEDIEIEGLLSGRAAAEMRPKWVFKPDILSRFRVETGFLQSDLAAQLGVRAATISDWEKGKTQPSPLAKEKIEQLVRRHELSKLPIPAADRIAPPMAGERRFAAQSPARFNPARDFCLANQRAA